MHMAQRQERAHDAEGREEGWGAPEGVKGEEAGEWAGARSSAISDC